jgi:plastocyanin
MNKTILAVIIVLVIVFGIYYFAQAPAAPVSPAVTAPVTEQPTTTPEATLAKIYNISVINYAFAPAVLNVAKGDTVVWINQDPVTHKIAGGALNGPAMSTGQSYSFVFNTPGTFEYHCAIHPSMKGTIIVK